MSIDSPPRDRAGRQAAVVVAHPDDESLWAGGLILMHPSWSFSIGALCRGSDPDRSPKFARVCSRLGAARSRITDLDDGPEQLPLAASTVESAVLTVVGGGGDDLLITHSPNGEYTRHLRHEETALAVARLWAAGRIRAKEVWMFAFEDSGRTKPPEAIASADLLLPLSDSIYQEKYRLITELYGFAPDSWEAIATPRVEGFWRFFDPRGIAEKFGVVVSDDPAGGSVA